MVIPSLSRSESREARLRALLVVALILPPGCAAEPASPGGDAATDMQAVGDAAVPERCVPRCSGRECGPDGCGGTCASCLADRVCDEVAGLCRTEASLMVALRDGVRLQTEVLLPSSGAGPFPTILVRTPYPEGSPQKMTFAPFVQQGYSLVVQTCRGVAPSEGKLAPMTQELADGHDAVSWIAAQPWSNQKVGTIGGSYEGYAAQAAAVDTPQVKVVISDGAALDFYAERLATYNGVPSWFLLWWPHYLETGEDLYADLKSLTTVTNTRPVQDLDLALFGKQSTLWRSVLPHLEKKSSFWDDWSLTGKLSRFCAPALHLQAATEALDGPRATFEEILQQPCSSSVAEAQRFVLGSHVHTGALYAPFDGSPTGKLVLGYLDKYLKDGSLDLSSVPRVQTYLRNADTWVASDGWPPTPARRDFYLAPAPVGTWWGSLSESPAPATGKTQYLFDPETDDACSQSFAALVDFRSPVLVQDLDIAGNVEAELHVSTSTPDADIFAYLYEVVTDTQWELVSLGGLRLRFRTSLSAPSSMVPDQIETVTIPMVAAGYRVRAGSRLVLTLCSSECGFPENANTGGAAASETGTRPVTVTVHSGPGQTSRLRIPVAAP